MGMEVRMVMEAPDEATARRAGTAAFATIAGLDQRLSDYRDTSDLRAIERAAPGAIRVHPDVLDVLSRALEVARASDGAFDPTVAPLVALWRASRESRRLPSNGELAAARRLVGWARVELDPDSQTVRLPEPGMRLDLGGIAKGFILQRAIETLREHGVTVAMVEAGGDIVAGDARRGSDGWRVALPARCSIGDVSAEEGSVLLRNEAFATSGAITQFVEIDGVRYSHVVDPRTGLGLTTYRTVHVRAPDGATADAWATALSVTTSSSTAPSVPRDVQWCVGR
jgi:thiamine biosynthesis lipoprotein